MASPPAKEKQKATEAARPTYWKVVGGKSTGGITVKTGQRLNSEELPERLARGALLKEVELVGERLSYKKLQGAGPATGWVSTKFKGNDLVVKHAPYAWVCAAGTRGDCQPYSALALGMKRAGFRVKVLTCDDYEDFVKGFGLDFHPLVPSCEKFIKKLSCAGQPSGDDGDELIVDEETQKKLEVQKSILLNFARWRISGYHGAKAVGGIAATDRMSQEWIDAAIPDSAADVLGMYEEAIGYNKDDPTVVKQLRHLQEEIWMLNQKRLEEREEAERKAGEGLALAAWLAAHPHEENQKEAEAHDNGKTTQGDVSGAKRKALEDKVSEITGELTSARDEASSALAAADAKSAQADELLQEVKEIEEKLGKLVEKADAAKKEAADLRVVADTRDRKVKEAEEALEKASAALAAYDPTKGDNNDAEPEGGPTAQETSALKPAAEKVSVMETANNNANDPKYTLDWRESPQVKFNEDYSLITFPTDDGSEGLWCQMCRKKADKTSSGLPNEYMVKSFDGEYVLGECTFLHNRVYCSDGKIWTIKTPIRVDITLDEGEELDALDKKLEKQLFDMGMEQAGFAVAWKWQRLETHVTDATSQTYQNPTAAEWGRIKRPAHISLQLLEKELNQLQAEAIIRNEDPMVALGFGLTAWFMAQLGSDKKRMDDLMAILEEEQPDIFLSNFGFGALGEHLECSRGIPYLVLGLQGEGMRMDDVHAEWMTEAQWTQIQTLNPAFYQFKTLAEARAVIPPIDEYPFMSESMYDAMCAIEAAFLEPYFHQTPIKALGRKAWSDKGDCTCMRKMIGFLSYPAQDRFTRIMGATTRSWIKMHTYTGFWMIDTDDQLAGSEAFGGPDLVKTVEEFLAKGSKPAYIGFGSCIGKVGPHYMCMCSVAALKWAKMRGIILAGWAGLSYELLEEAVGKDDPVGLCKYAKENVLFLKKAPQTWLFPKCCAVVIHGGVGTLAAAWGSGSPTIVCPVWLDQFDNSFLHAIMQAGSSVGGGIDKVTPQALADYIVGAATSDGAKVAAAFIRSEMRKDNGIKKAIECIDRILTEEVPNGNWLGTPPPIRK